VSDHLQIELELERPGFRLELAETLGLNGITTVFGPSGSGKTTLLRSIAGLERTARGRVVCAGTIWQDERVFVPAHARRIGYVFQDGRLFSHLDVRGNLRFAVRHRPSGARIAFDDVVAALDLDTLLDREPTSLSGGEEQRVAIGRALLTDPRLLLMDEPVSSLDAARRLEIVHYVERLPARFGLPVIYVTHSVDEAARLADDMLLLSEGRVVAHGPAKNILESIDLWSSTGRLEAGSLLDTRVIAHDRGMTELAVDDATLRVPGIEAEPGTSVRLKINARDVVIATERPLHLSIRNVLAAEIESISIDRAIYAELLLRVGGQGLRARITQEALQELGLAEGRKVFALIKSVAFDEYLGR
jgi:molybdate transport system ATP-binding protein